MRLRPRLVLGILAVLLLAAVSACGGGSDPKSAASSPSNPITRLGTPGATDDLTEIAVPCTKYSDLARKIVEAQTKLYSGSGAADVISTLVESLQSLKDGAPSDVRAALDDLSSAFEKARSELSAPTDAGKAELQELASKLSSDGQKISAYVVSRCTS